ncbi:MAG: MazG family protein [Mycobacteriaceae bacterium]
MTVVLVDPQHPTQIPLEAVQLIALGVQYTEELPVRVPWVLKDARPVGCGDRAAVLLSSDVSHPEVRQRIFEGEDVIRSQKYLGDNLIHAVDIIDRMRSHGPWEAQQTHESLRRYLLEETYELCDAIEQGNAGEICGELGDVLLQVLFHARIAQESNSGSFTIDDVAQHLIEKLKRRAPRVVAGIPVTIEEQIADWENSKAMEKAESQNSSYFAGIALTQPALSLAQKVITRVRQAGFPDDLLPEELSLVRPSDVTTDAEAVVRKSALAFMKQIDQICLKIEPTEGVLDIAEERWRELWSSSS